MFNLYFSSLLELSLLYNNTAHPVTCKGWHFTHMWCGLVYGV